MSTHVTALTPAERSKKIRSWTIFIVTNLISLICLIWVLTGADLNQIWGDVQEMNWRWVFIAIVADCCIYLLHGVRWKLMLAPIEAIPYWKTIEAIYVGLFANEVLPLRAGELIRCFLLSKLTDLPLSVTFASALIERIFDGIWLMICFFCCLHMGKLPGVLLKGGYVLGIMIVIAALIIGFAMYAKKQSLDLVFGWSWPRWFNTLIEDLHLIGHSRFLYYSFIVSGIYLLAQVVPIYALVQANDLDVPWTASFAMMVLLRLSSIIPQAPGNLGSFQWVTARTLIMFGLFAPLAKRFSLILWAVVTLPLIVIGCICLAITGMNMSHLHKQATAAVNKRRVA
ncbi:MAG: flippase-like domain-containing protein [Acidobacteriaceae bacterium]|nr:flippase-like domain-containing protein [Acidobacteriaceae bacterium]